MKSFILWSLPVLLACGAMARADHPIPADSKHRWDFRGPPRALSDEAYVKLFSCKTYEELRDALIVAIENLEGEQDCTAPYYVASSCRLALIRTYYLLGDVENADRLLEEYSAVHRGPDGGFDLNEPLRPLEKKEKGAEGEEKQE